MSVASIVMSVVSGMVTCLGIFPCFGWLQWFAVPISAATVVIGLIGLATDREADGTARGIPAHVAAVGVGTLLVAIGTLRCLVGGGVL